MSNIDTKISFLFLIIFILILCVLHNKNREHFKNSKVNIDCIYAINLKESKDRYDILKKNISKYDYKLNRFDAINGNNIDIEKTEKDLDIKIRKTMRKGNLGCALSHYYLIKSLKNTNYDHVLILEDDVVFSDKFNNISNILNEIDFDFDILFLGGCNIYGSLYKKNFIRPKKSNNQSIKRYNMCLHGYIIKRKNIDNVLNCIDKINLPIDIIIRNNIDKLKLYYLKEPVIFQNRNLKSVLQSYNSNKLSMPKNYKNINDVTII